jgi:hypothetical protein
MRPRSSDSWLSFRRRPAAPDVAGVADDDDTFREHPHPVLLIVWAASVARVVGAIHYRETLGAEATLALMTMVAVTWYWIAAHAPARRRGPSQPSQLEREDLPSSSPSGPWRRAHDAAARDATG